MICLADNDIIKKLAICNLRDETGPLLINDSHASGTPGV